MPQPERQRAAIDNSRLYWLLTDDGSRTLWDSELDETFHSGCGAVAESLEVYLGNSGVLNRLRSGIGTRVLEYGFGTSTAFLLTAALAEVCRTPLVYVGIERQLLPATIFQALNIVDATKCYLDNSERDVLFPTHYSLALSTLQQSWVNFRGELPQQPLNGIYKFQLGEFVSLVLWLGDARGFDQQTVRDMGEELFDAIYFDPFSPSTSPELWTQAVFVGARSMLVAQGTFTSYCVKSDVRRALSAAGFRVAKVAGPTGGKREVLLATNDRP